MPLRSILILILIGLKIQKQQASNDGYSEVDLFNLHNERKKADWGSNKSIYCTELGFNYILLSFFGLTDTLVNGSQTHTQYP